ncbi:ABC transporter permease [Candidatus Dependentiae bacterium]|nr:ABC transporter permease [Candidatus Dependentiae bacterium]
MVENRKYMGQFFMPLMVAVAYLFLYLPIFVLVLFSFNNANCSVAWAGFSLKWYQKLVSSPEILDALQASLIVALSTTFLSLLIGTCFIVASRWGGRSSLFSNVFYVNILLPEIVLAIGILSIFTFFQLPLGYGSLIAGHTLLGLGFVIPIVRARFCELDPVLTEASLDMGATYWQTFLHVLIPLLMPSLLASGLLVFTLSMDDFLISFFCSGPTVQTLSVYVYSMIRTGVDPMINAISTCFLVISSLLVFLLCSLKVVDQVLGHD